MIFPVSSQKRYATLYDQAKQTPPPTWEPSSTAAVLVSLFSRPFMADQPDNLVLALLLKLDESDMPGIVADALRDARRTD